AAVAVHPAVPAEVGHPGHRTVVGSEGDQLATGASGHQVELVAAQVDLFVRLHVRPWLRPPQQLPSPQVHRGDLRDRPDRPGRLTVGVAGEVDGVTDDVDATHHLVG